jgi:hypothetical protein
MNNIQELKQIIEQGEKIGATHVDNVPSYYKMDSHGREWGIFKGSWCVCVGCNTMRMPPSMRALSDIKTIIEQHEEIERLKAKVDSLESDLIELGAQGHYYAVTYKGSLHHVSISEENANKYSDKFGGVYGVEQVDMAVAFNNLNQK